MLKNGKKVQKVGFKIGGGYDDTEGLGKYGGLTYEDSLGNREHS